MTATLLGLRLGRWGFVGFSTLAFFSSLVQALGFYQLAGHSPADRAGFGQSMSALASRFTLILPPPSRLDTVGGYVQWRSFGSLSILFAVWALASASAAARGDEERGLVEAELAATLTRAGLIASRLAGFAAASLVAALAGGLGLIVVATHAGEALSLWPVLEQSVVLAALALNCYALTLLVAQVVAARFATAAAGSLLLALFLLNSLSRTYASLSSLRWLSPFRYYEISQALSPGGLFDVRATDTLVGIAVAAGCAAAIAFALRDLGSPLVRFPVRSSTTSYEVSRVLAWRIPIARGLYERRVSLAVWALGVAVLGTICVALTKSIVEPLLSIRELAPFFSAFVHGDVYRSFLGYVWFAPAQLIFAAFAITQVGRWSTEDADGRLEMILAAPQSRAGVVLERAVVLAVGATVIAAIAGVAVGSMSHRQSIDLDPGRLAAASLLLVPFALVFAAAGSVLAAWKPRASIGLLGAFAFASYLIAEVGPVMGWPGWIQDLSAFKLFGAPLVDGVDRGALATMLAIIFAGFGASMLLMRRRDIGA